MKIWRNIFCKSIYCAAALFTFWIILSETKIAPRYVHYYLLTVVPFLFSSSIIFLAEKASRIKKGAALLQEFMQ